MSENLLLHFGWSQPVGNLLDCRAEMTFLQDGLIQLMDLY